MSRALREVRKKTYGGSVAKRPRGGAVKRSHGEAFSPEFESERAIAPAARRVPWETPMFTPEFEAKHLHTLPGSRVTGSGISQRAIGTYSTRQRQAAAPPGANTLIGVSPMTRRNIENKLRRPGWQSKLARGEPVDIYLPPKGPLDEGPLRHRSYAVQVASPFNYTTYQQPSTLTVGGRQDPSTGHWRVNHLFGITQGDKPPTQKDIPRPGVARFSDSD